jgi:hypothetical protein
LGRGFDVVRPEIAVPDDNDERVARLRWLLSSYEGVLDVLSTAPRSTSSSPITPFRLSGRDPAHSARPRAQRHSARLTVNSEALTGGR